MHRLPFVLAAAITLACAALVLGDRHASATRAPRAQHDRDRAVQSVTALRYGLDRPVRPLGTEQSPLAGAGFP